MTETVTKPDSRLVSVRLTEGQNGWLVKRAHELGAQRGATLSRQDVMRDLVDQAMAAGAA